MLSLYGMMQAANRMLFNQAEDEFLDGDEVVGMGTLGKEGSGRLRMQASCHSLMLVLPASECFVQMISDSGLRSKQPPQSQVAHCL